MLTTYTVKSKNTKNVWEFKYDLKGNLKAFNILDGALSETQIVWLFVRGKFPVKETDIKENWIPNLKKNFEITIGEMDLSFDAFWNEYDNKVGKRKMAENIWNRLSKAEKILVMLSIPRFKNYLKYYPAQQMMYATTYLNQEAYKNDYKVT